MRFFNPWSGIGQTNSPVQAMDPPLMSVEDRCERMRELGIEQLFLLNFTHEVARLAPEEFVAQFVCGVMQARAVLVGGNGAGTGVLPQAQSVGSKAVIVKPPTYAYTPSLSAPHFETFK